MKIDPSCCRLCFIYDEDPIDIFGDTLTESRITDLLAQYFMDQVTQDDALPKVVCHDCWNHIDMFHSFVQRIIAVREDYLRQPSDVCAKVENEEDTFESVPSMDEMNIHVEDVCVEPVSMGSGDPMAGKIELMDTKFQIDMEENETISNSDVECDEIVSDADQIEEQNTINTEPMAHIDTHTESKSSRDPLNSSSEENEYICDICNESFSSKFIVKRHLHAHFEKPQKPTCHICYEQFKSERILERHSRYAHVESPDEDLIEIKPEPMISDDSVPDVFEESDEGPEEKLESVKLEHQLCDICGLQGQTCLCTFQHHPMSYAYDDERPFQCDICRKRFKSKGTLHSHKYTHSSGPQKCNQCDKISPNMNALRTHIRSVHCKSNFKCYICEKTFKLQPALRDHIAMHKGEKNYKCTFCNEAFIWRMDMYAHRKAMHKEQWMVERARNKAKLMMH